MFTMEELDIMQSALSRWEGPYHYNDSLNAEEQKRQKHELYIAQRLCAHFREILAEYYNMSRR